MLLLMVGVNQDRILICYFVSDFRVVSKSQLFPNVLELLMMINIVVDCVCKIKI